MSISMAIGSSLDPARYRGPVIKTVTFAGATPNAIGDHDGTGDPVTLYTVTGDVIVKIIAVCTTSLSFDANATIEVGIAGG